MTIFTILIAYIIGIIWGLYAKSIVPLFFILIIFLILKKIKNVNRYINKIFPKKLIIISIITFIIGYTYTSILENSFENKYKNVEQEVTIKAIVISNAKDKEYKKVYTIKVESINEDKSFKGTYLQLSVKNIKQEIKYGDKIEFSGEFKRATGQRNYKGFNYREYLKTKKVYGLVETNNISSIQNEKYNKFLILINNLNNKITQNANEILEKEEASLLTGILIGNKENLSKETTQSFRNSNLSHMLAVSGAHVSYVILAITFILQKSKMHKKVTKIITIFILIFFVILTGGTASVTRACIMAIYIIIGTLIYKKPNILASISISMLIILAINPYKILDVGFQLSYGGTIGIILFNKIIEEKIKLPNFKYDFVNKIMNSIVQMAIVSISANLIIFPIIAYHYSTISLTFFISNILAGPILGIIIILGFITIFISFISIPISKVLSIILSIFLKLLILIANFSSNLPLSKIYVKTPSIAGIILYYIILGLVLYIMKCSCHSEAIHKHGFNKRQRRFEKIFLRKIKNREFQKKAIAVMLVIVLSFQVIKIIPSNLKIYFIDVGQGDSTLLVTPKHKTILIDGGGSLDKEIYDVGENTLLPYLLAKGITKLDYIIISHFDSDHVRTECLL